MSIIFDSQISKQFIKYVLVGILLTAVGLLSIFTFIWLGVPIYWANFLGYAIGCCVSYLLNSKYTFSQQYSKRRVIKFFVGIAIAYCINVLAVFLVLLCDSDARYLSQIIGVVFYTLAGFLINKFWAMK